jgi:hypothetical protein
MDNAIKKFGLSPEELAGKTTLAKADTYAARYEDLLDLNEVAVFIDLFDFDGDKFLHAVVQPDGFKINISVKTKNERDLLQALSTACSRVMQYGKRVKYIISDSESAIVSAEDEIMSHGIRVEIKSPGTKVGIVERSIRTQKNLMRTKRASLPFKMPKIGRQYGMQGQAVISNVFSTKSGAPGVSAFESLTGEKPDIRRFCRVAYGTPCLVTDYKKNNNAESNTIECIAVAPAGSREGAWYFLKILNGEIIRSDHWTPTPLTQEMIFLLNSRAARDNKGVVDEDYLEPDQNLEFCDAEPTELPGEALDKSSILEERDLRFKTPEKLNIDHDTSITNGANLARDIAAEETVEVYDAPLSPLPPEQTDVSYTVDEESEHVVTEEGTNDTVDEESEHVVAEEGTNDPDTEVAIRQVSDQSRFSRERRVHNYAELHSKGTTANCFRIYATKLEKAIQKYGDAGKDSIVTEIRQLHDFGSFAPVNVDNLNSDQRKRIIRSLIFLKEKYTPTGEFDKLKARLVARGDQQDKSLYEVLSSPTVALSSIFIISWLIAGNSFKVGTIDIVGAFLNAEETHEVHMRLSKEITDILLEIDKKKYQPFICGDGSMVVKLVKALYGLVEAPRLWYDLLARGIENCGYRRCEYDECVFARHNEKNNVLEGIIALHVDDLLIGCRTEAELTRIATVLKQLFRDIKLSQGNNINYLGMTFSFEANRVTITQEGYVADLLSYYGPSKRTFNPASGKLFNIDTEEKLLDNSGQDYLRSGVAKLLYLCKRTVPELMTAVAFLCSRAGKYTTEDLAKFDKAIQFLSTYEHTGLTLHHQGDNPVINVYVDASHGIHANGKSHTGCVISLGDRATIYTKSAKQKLVSKSSTEAELIALSTHSQLSYGSETY